MHPAMREDALAERRHELLRGVDHRRQITEAHLQATNRRRGNVHRDASLRVWLLHQLTWPRWPRAATSEA